MTHSEQQLGLQSKATTSLLWFFVIVAFLGFLDATYLTMSHFTGAQLYCGVEDTCSIVTSSKYATVFGIPVALGGSLYYLAVLILSLLVLDKRSKKLAKVLGLITIAGLLASGWFVFVQLVLLEAICYYCMVSAGTSSILFVLGMVLLSRLRKEK